jgi:hypothetical protein
MQHSALTPTPLPHTRERGQNEAGPDIKPPPLPHTRERGLGGGAAGALASQIINTCSARLSPVSECARTSPPPRQAQASRKQLTSLDRGASACGCSRRTCKKPGVSPQVPVPSGSSLAERRPKSSSEAVRKHHSPADLRPRKPLARLPDVGNALRLGRPAERRERAPAETAERNAAEITSQPRPGRLAGSKGEADHSRRPPPVEEALGKLRRIRVSP